MAPTEDTLILDATWTIQVKTSDGKGFHLEEVRKDSTLFDVKELCASRCGIAAIHQRLFLKGKQLTDSQTLAEAGLCNNATIFLTKAPSWKTEMDKAPAGTVPCAGGCGFFGTSRTDNFCSKCYLKQSQVERDHMWNGIFAGESGEDAEADRAQNEELVVTALKVGVPVRVHGLNASKELNGRLGWIVKYLEETSRFGVKLKGEEGTKALRPQNLRKLDTVTPLSASQILVQKDRTRCWCCSRKCGLTGFTCRCGYVFCGRHRHAEDHECDFDHQRMGQELISKNNQKLQAKQWDILNSL